MIHSKIDESIARIRGEQKYAYLIANVNLFFASKDPSIHGRAKYPGKRSTFCFACHYRVKGLPNTMLHNGGRHDLSHFSFDLSGGPFLLVTMFGDLFQLF